MNKCKYKCKYCKVSLEFTNELLYVCPSCGLLYTLEFKLTEWEGGYPIGYCKLIPLEGRNITKYKRE